MSLLGSCLYPVYIALLGLAFVYFVALWMHTNSSDFFKLYFKSCGWKRFFLSLGAEVDGLYIKVAFINIIYVT